MVELIKRYTNVLTPFDFGATGDGVTDDTAALMAMAAAVNALVDNSHDSYYNELTPLVWLPPCNGFRIDRAAGLEINAGFDLISDAPLLVAGAAGAARPGWVIKDGRAVTNQAPRRNKLEFDVRRIVQSDWTNTAAGVEIQCLYAPHIMPKWIEGFARGVNGAGSYLLAEIGEIYNCQEGFRWSTFNNGLSGEFSNALRITGREIRCDGGSPAGKSRWGVVLIGVAPNGINTAEIHIQSYELNLGTAKNGNANGVAHPVRLDGTFAGVANVAISGRSEANSKEFVEAVGVVYDISIEILQQNSRSGEPDSGLVKLPASAASGIVAQRATGVSKMRTIFDSGRFADNAVVGDSGNTINIRNMEVMTNTGGFQRLSQGGWNSFTDDGHFLPYVVSQQILGIMINLNGERGLGLSFIKKAGDPVDIVIKCWDSEGSAVTSSGAISQQYSKIEPNHAYFGGCYAWRFGLVDLANNFQDDVGFAANIARVFIGMWRLSADIATRVESMEVRSPLGLAKVVSGGANLLDSQLYMSSSPASAPLGVPSRHGTRVYNSMPMLGAPQGWVFDGSAWRAMPNL